MTAPDEVRPVAEALVVEMGGEPVWVPESARPLYHAALSHGANHLVTLVNDAVAALAGAGVQDGARLLAPLLSAALDNALRLGDAALTGPVSRADLATLSAHRRALAHAPELVPSYLALARRTAERAHAAGRLTDAAGRSRTGDAGAVTPPCTCNGRYHVVIATPAHAKRGSGGRR